MRAGSVGGSTVHGLLISMGSRMIGVLTGVLLTGVLLTGALRGDANGEPWTPGEEEESWSNEGTIVTAVASPPVLSRPCDFWAEGEL